MIISYREYLETYEDVKYYGYSVESVLGRLPTEKIEKQEKSPDGKRNIFTISAEMFGYGIDMWIRSQGDNIKMI